MKVINTEVERTSTQKASKIPVGTVFTGTLSSHLHPISRYFLCILGDRKAFVDLEDSRHVWELGESGADLSFDNYHELSAELYVNYKKP